MQALLAFTGNDIDRDIAAAAARVLDPIRDRILAVHVVHPRDVEATANTGGSLHQQTIGPGAIPVTRAADPSLVEDVGQAVQRVEDELRSHVDDLKRVYLGDFTVDFEVIIHREPADAIIAAVEKHGIGGVVMDTRDQRSRFSSAVLGSCAETVVRRGMAPVLIVKEGSIVGASRSRAG